MEKPWADQPFALLTIPGSTPTALKTSNPGVMSVCIEMANVHNTLLRGLNSIYLQAPHVSEPADIMDLMFYTKAWAAGVHVHHASEETVFFPKVDAWAKEAGLDAGLMEGNIEQHHAFETGLEETLKWSEEVRAGTKAFDAKILIGLIDTFAPLLTQHLHDEIDTLIRLEKCDGEKVRKAFKLTADESLKKASLDIVIPLVFGCIDKGYPGSADFPPVPFVLPYINAYWFSRKHKGSWRFNPCDDWGRPRPLHFL